MEPAKKSLIYKIAGSAFVAIYGLTTGVLMSIVLGDVNKTAQLLTLASTLVICGAALAYIWMPRKKSPPSQ